MRNTVPLVLALASASLSGCVVFPTHTTATPEHTVKAAERERVLAFQEQSAVATATLIVTRDLGAFGSACYYAVEINGKLAARLDMGERSYFHLAPGEATLRAGGDPLARGLCSIGQGERSGAEGAASSE